MIVEMKASTAECAEWLVRRVFPWQGPAERMFYWAWHRRHRPEVRWLMRVIGIAAIEDTWVDVDGEGRVRGTIGIYATTTDETEARWVSWFCVDPDTRGLGIGKGLLDHLIGIVRARGYRYLRLYTGSDPDEARAQVLYESRGLRETRRVPLPLLGFDKIYRELELTGPDRAP